MNLAGKGWKRLSYANDIQIYIQVPAHQIERRTDILSESDCNVSEWAINNDFTLNATKTRAIVFGSPVTLKLFRVAIFSQINFFKGLTGSKVIFRHTKLSYTKK